MSSARIIEAALAARTERDAQHLDELIAEHVGACFYRPIGDRVNNFGLMTTSGSYDFKLIENVTNMQDALLERAAAARFGDIAGVPYATPHEAAARLFEGRGEAELARCASVEFFEADTQAKQSKRLTAVFRDEGCGIEPAHVGDTIFALGSAHKSKSIWQQGAFGIGGATTFRNAVAVVLVSRRAPEMRPDEDCILVAVCMWQHSLKGKGLFYLVTTDWDEGRNPMARPWSAPAAQFPDFAPGTHVSLINYGTERLHAIRHPDNPSSFDRILDTRLFSPVSPVRFRNHLIRDDHARVRRGLERRFADNPRPDRREQTAMMPFRVGGTTYELPVTFYFFDAVQRAERGPDTVGDKKNFVAHGHSLMFTSNGQVHHHWTPLEFRDRTKLNKIADHVLVVVETDPLPIAVRTDFFTADRPGVRASEETLRLESSAAEFLAGWDELKEIKDADIAVGPLHGGRIRVIVTVPAEAQVGEFVLVAGIYGWERAAGGLGEDLEWETRFEVIREAEKPPRTLKNGKSDARSKDGPQVALLWRSGEEIGLTPVMPGKIEEVAARLIAAEPEYAELAELGNAPVLTIYLNEDYAPLKRYLGVRQRDLVRAAGSPAADRYAVDVGVAMLVLHQAREARVKKGDRVDEETMETARHAAAQGTVSILPQFDELVRQAGLEE